MRAGGKEKTALPCLFQHTTEGNAQSKGNAQRDAARYAGLANSASTEFSNAISLLRQKKHGGCPARRAVTHY
jgi:hypothetical protein